MKGRTLISRMVNVVLALLLAMNTFMVLLPAQPAAAAGNLTLTIIAAPNLVVDSNALSPSTYSPKVATVIAKVCNTGPDPVNNVVAYIGDYTGSGTTLGTPGIYPTRTDVTIGPAGTQTTYNGTYSFTHLGGASDASRFVGTLANGECRYQYWSFEYPLLANGGTIPTWGTSVKPDDDLSLNFDMWVRGDVDGDGTVEPGEYVQDTHTMTMRNEISAMANKIRPNGNPAGEWFNTDTSTVYPGQTVTTNGILYRLGNINQGFDNDGDGVPDYNAWLQPFGDPAYDPSCFRLVGVTGTLTVTRGSGNPDMIIPIYNNLYFTNLPPDNTDVRGLIYYEFLALGGACTVPITPYQEVASGSDNEKFNGDYGTGVPALMSYEPEVDITKSAPGTQAVNTTLTYSIPFANNSPDVPAGLILTAGGVSVNAGLMISDTVPAGLQYIGNSASTANTIPTGNSVSIRYSTDGGVTWLTSDPGTTLSTAAAPFVIQWWLNQPLDDSTSGNNAGTVRYQAAIPSTYVTSGGDPFIENCAEASFGDAPSFDRACAITMVQGNNSIGDFIWRDEDGDGIQDGGAAEPGLDDVTVRLYWDANSNGTVDEGEFQINAVAVDVIDGKLDLDDNGTADDNGEFDAYNIIGGLVDVNGDGSITGDDNATGLINGYDVIDGYLDMDHDGSTSLPDGDDDGQVTGTMTQSQSATITAGVVAVTSGSATTFAGYNLIGGLLDIDGDGSITAADDGTGLIGGYNAYSGANAVVLYDVTNGYVTSGGANVANAALSGNYGFAYLPNAHYVVEVVATDYDVTTGYTPTSPKQYAVNLSAGGVNNRTSDFSFGPTLVVNKYLTSANPAYEGDLITFDIDLINKLPGDGSASGFCQYVVWTTQAGSNDNGTGWQNKPGAYSSVSGRDSNLAYLLPGDNLDRISASNVSLGLPTGATFRKVEAIYSIYVDNAFSDDTLYARFWRGATGYTSVVIPIATLNTYGPGVSQQDIFAWDVTTGYGTWAVSDFSGSTLQVGFEAKKGGGSGDTMIRVDAMGFRVTTNELCGNADTTIATLPLTDTYDADMLEFVSASPAHTTQNTSGSAPNTVGTITWANLGPLYAGGTKTVQVTFKALDPAANSATTTNTGSVTNAYFGNGRKVNDGSDAADVTINATGSIAGTVWSDRGTIGWQGTTGYESLGSTDFGIAGATVTLYGCYTGDPASGGTLVTSPTKNKTCAAMGGGWYPVPDQVQTTDQNGYYKFEGLREGFYYTGVSLPAWASGATQSAEPVHLSGSVPTGGTNGGLSCTSANATCDGTWNPTGSADTVANTVLLANNETTLYYNPIGTYGSSPNEDITNVNFGYQGVPARIYGKVYLDSNGDGDQDTGEADLSGVSVRLCSDATCTTVLQTASTATEGTYGFSVAVPSGNYYVQVNNGTPVAGTVQTDDPDSTGTCSGGGCDNSTDALTLVAGQSNGSHDFGYQPSGSYTLGDTIYYDWNGDGTQDTGDLGISNITIYLYEDEDNDGVIDAEDALIATDVTDSSGAYTFGNLPSGYNYIVIVDTADVDFPSGLTQTGDPDGACPGTTCDSRSTSAAINGTDDLDNDFGYQPRGQGQIGDYVWLDTNGDGVQNIGESGQSNVTVNLYHDANGDGVIDADDALIATTDTIGYNVINGYIDVDGDGNAISPDVGDNIPNLFGYKIVNGGVDLDGDDAISGTDDGYFGAYRVIDGRLDMNGDGSASDTDDGDLKGYYLFIDLPSGDYQGLPADDYIVQIAPAEFSTGGDLAGLALTNTGSDYNAAQVSRAVNLSHGEKFYEADFGFASSAIGDFIWQDSNGDGLWENGEVGISGVVMELYLDANNDGVADGAAIATATTDSNGLYLFGGLAPNNYLVKVQGDPTLGTGNFASGGALQGYTLTGDPNSYNTTAGETSLSCLATGAQECDGENWLRGITVENSDSTTTFFYGLQQGQNDMSSDFGYQPPALIGDFIWQDLDGDGVQDSGEPGIEGVTVNLYEDDDNDGVIDAEDALLATVTTNSDGYYYFTGRPAGNYIVQIDPSNFTSGQPLEGYTQTGDPEGDNNNIGDANTTGNVSDLSNDFGYQGSALISGTIFFDRGTLGGLYESGDVPFPGVPVYLYDSSGALVGSTLTDNNGHYKFNVATGTYTIRVGQALSTRINGMTFTYEPDEADDDGYCGSGSLTCNNATSVNTGDTDAATQDFGFFAAIDMGDLPTGYNYTITMLEEGPIHIDVDGTGGTSIRLGSTWDSELDGSPDAGAGMNGGTTGDDRLGTDDEDGVSFLNTWVHGEMAQLRFVIADADSLYTPYLVGWFDWNNDGDFHDAYEMEDFGNLEAGTYDRNVVIRSTTTNPSVINMRFRIYATQSPPPVIAPTGTVINGEVEDYQRDLNPTAIMLASFEAKPQDDAILVTWETAMELDNVGFNLYRSTAAAGTYTRLNAALIPPQFPGEPMGGVYEWLDADVQPGVTYFYKLEDIDVKGVSTFHGPVSTAVATAPTAVHLQRVDARGVITPLALGLAAVMGLLVVRRRRH